MRKSILIFTSVIFALTVGYVLLIIVVGVGYEEAHANRAMLDLRLIGEASGRISVAEWEEVQDMDSFAPLVAPRLESGEATLMDTCGGGRYQFARQDDNDLIVITLSSQCKTPRMWLWTSDKPLAIEITISRKQGKVTQIKQLWRDE